MMATKRKQSLTKGDIPNSIIQDVNTNKPADTHAFSNIGNSSQPIKDTNRDLPLVKVDIFARACTIKYDQVFAFLGYAKRMNMGPKTMLDWYDAYDAFMNMEVK